MLGCKAFWNLWKHEKIINSINVCSEYHTEKRFVFTYLRQYQMHK